MTARPLVTVQAPKSSTVSTVTLPYVFVSPIRSDVVRFVHTLMNKNHRQPYAVSRTAGHGYSAESWGTGRAVARIPRISGSGTSRSGQAAFGNMCRGGRMFGPTKTYRKWHKKISKNQRRFATCAALAATAVLPLVQARGHKVEKVAEVPLVVKDQDLATVGKTKDAVALLKALNAYDDIERVKESRGLRRGKGKQRNRRYVQRRGPLVVYTGKSTDPQLRAFRNIPGVDMCNVNRLNLLQLAPGGHLGRFIIWTKDAFAQLDKIFGTFKEESAVKKGFILPPSMLTNTDITRIMRSEEVRRALKPKKLQAKKPSTFTQPSNGMRNRRLRLRLNPFTKKQTIASKGMRNAKLSEERRKSKLIRLRKVKKAVKANIAKNKSKAAAPATKKTVAKK